MMMLKPNCECCDRDLPPESSEARVCTYECTFCAKCVDEVLQGVCPNCEGNFTPRPIRPVAMLLKDPASTERHVRSDSPCSKLWLFSLTSGPETAVSLAETSSPDE